MSLDHILLGMLRRPSTGYELGTEFSKSAQHFWFAERSQIYPTLKRMRDGGLLTSWEEPSERGPRRKVYETTSEGRRELREWLLEGPQIGHERLAHIAQTFFLGELDDFAESLRIVKKMRAKWASKLAYLEFTEATIRDEDGEWSQLDMDDFHYHAALRMGLHMLRAKITWCDETAEHLQERLGQSERVLVRSEG